jgi:hypothetical protein
MQESLRNLYKDSSMISTHRFKSAGNQAINKVKHPVNLKRNQSVLINIKSLIKSIIIHWLWAILSNKALSLIIA